MILWLNFIAKRELLWAISIKGNITCGGNNRAFMLIGKKKHLHRGS